MIEIISATRLSEATFWDSSALGLSLTRLAYDSRLVPYITFENKRGLPDIFNPRIFAQDGHDLLVFVHDDVWIDDYFLADRVIEGLRKYNVIGVAGNRRRVAGQACWAFVDGATIDTDHELDKGNCSGVVAHGTEPRTGIITSFGPTPADCELMDGLFLATQRSILLAHGVSFDPRFDFHFYDLDFCRRAKQMELTIGTWPIALTHQSGGRLDDLWRQRYQAYIEKWGD